MVATAKTVYGIVRYFEQTAADAGIKPQQVRVRASMLAHRIDIHRDTLTSALNEDYLGFAKDETGYWTLTKEYDWKEVKECFESTYSDVIKLAVWREQKDITVAPVGDSDLVRTTNTQVNKKCDKLHVPKEFEDIKACFTDKLINSPSKLLTEERLSEAIRCLETIKEGKGVTRDYALVSVQVMLAGYATNKEHIN